MFHRLGLAVLPAVALALAVPAPAGAANAKTVSDPAGDVAYTAADGYTPLGPAAWADLLQATFKVTKGKHLEVTLQTADLPETAGPGGMWGVDGTVTRPNGRARSFNAWVEGTGEDYAGVGSKSCRVSSSVSPATNTVVLRINFSACVGGAAKVTLRAKGTVKGARTVAPSTYYQAVYTDDTVSKNLRLR